MRISEWLDRQISVLSELCWLRLRPHGRLAVIGNALAGVHNHQHLPIERYALKPQEPANLLASSASMVEGGGGVSSLAVSPATVSCTEWQYCYMHGYPCACCGGSDTGCPSGTSAGSHWPYCCSTNTIWFIDCCGGTTTCPNTCSWCTNSTQPNWCGGVGNNRYVCTLAVKVGYCS
jgi:methylamine dehydrogenase light chain